MPIACHELTLPKPRDPAVTPQNEKKKMLSESQHDMRPSKMTGFDFSSTRSSSVGCMGYDGPTSNTLAWGVCRGNVVKIETRTHVTACYFETQLSYHTHMKR